LQTLFSRYGQPGLAPGRWALVTILPFLENLSDRQAAEAVRARLDGKYALGLELTDPGFHFSVLTEFRARLAAGGAEQLLLDGMREQFRQRELVKARGKQRTDSTHVLAAVHRLPLWELVGETLRAALNDLATVAPDWLRAVAQPEWFERYAHRVEDYRLPRKRNRPAKPMPYQSVRMDLSCWTLSSKKRCAANWAGVLRSRCYNESGGIMMRGRRRAAAGGV